MIRRVLLVSSASPYPVVTNGCARLVGDYLTQMFPADEVYFLFTRPGDWAPLRLYYRGLPVAEDLAVSGLLSHDFAFVFFSRDRRVWLAGGSPQSAIDGPLARDRRRTRQPRALRLETTK